MRAKRRSAMVGALLGACVFLVPEASAGAQTDNPRAADTDAREAAVHPNRVATMNLFKPGGRKPWTTAQEIAKHAPQVVGLQEVCLRDTDAIVRHLKERGLTYYATVGPASQKFGCGRRWGIRGSYGNVILSATPITDSGHQSYPEGGSEGRSFVWANAVVDGVETKIFNTHLAQGPQADVREKQARFLADHVKPHTRAIVLGDFNSEPWLPAMSPMTSLLWDADPYCGPVQDKRCTPTADASPNRKKFDYVFLNRAYAPPPGVSTHNTFSDHDLVYADVKAKF
ncbi:endonuclease/exonuclease/phosphatase family protein [Streptomyces sp. BA2]|uniref:endonuclease/exonuclease/phosphatase family protein n=1 Tax=Streptomyces sp. BA2 TaxID=436595 RepID=UPI00132C811E|nr:endonuclease/exonuclease/phosphatase family protein [Streptomyces sp. BA2]MWA08384.1 endonuclease/exonuclease/phosphatase family protein [Streptomyces sp. BA2]